MMKKIAKILLSKFFLLSLMAVAQVSILIFLVINFSQKGSYIYIFLTILSALVSVGLIQNDKINSAYRTIWLFIIVSLPVTGFILYVLWGKHNNRKLIQKLKQINFDTNITNNGNIVKDTELDKTLQKNAHYLQEKISAPIFTNSDVKYFSTGEEYFEVLKEELLKANKSIFMEYFIISRGTLWNELSSILKTKAKNGVDVRIIYDGLGSLFTFDNNKADELKACGVKFATFNPVKFFLSISNYRIMNFRDHRKICVIDSDVSFSGGVNVADEYANIIEKFGYWKDNGYMIKGPASLSFTSIFLKNWQLITKQKDSMLQYTPSSNFPSSDILIQTYWDSPIDYEDVSEIVYHNFINNASDYVYITTPYLIIDNTMISALTSNALSGVNIKIIVPGVPDKKIVNLITKSYYKVLLDAGVEIYEYSPGFIHSKMYISDDKVCNIGTVNTDYRSLFLNYENSTLFYNEEFTKNAKKDFTDTLDLCKKIDNKDINSLPFRQKFIQKFMRIFAPLL